MSKQTTKATIDANIKQNGVQAITGQILNSVLNTMVDDYATQEEVTSLASKHTELEKNVGINIFFYKGSIDFVTGEFISSSNRARTNKISSKGTIIAPDGYRIWFVAFYGMEEYHNEIHPYQDIITTSFSHYGPEEVAIVFKKIDDSEVEGNGECRFLDTEMANNFNNKLIKLKAITTVSTNIPDIQIGDVWYNTNRHRLRKWNGVDNIDVPFIDGSIYTYANELYVWNGTDLLNVTHKEGYGDFLREIKLDLDYCPLSKSSGNYIVYNYNPAKTAISTPNYYVLPNNHKLYLRAEAHYNMLAVVFYNKNYERITDSGWIEMPESVNIDVTSYIPDNAVYFKIAIYDPNGLKKVNVYAVGRFEFDANITRYNIRPIDGFQTLQVPVNVTRVRSTNEQTATLQDWEEFLPDYGLLALPDTYSNEGKPTRLIIYCHGAGVHYTSETTRFPDRVEQNGLNPAYWLSEGYAVMDIEGNPFDNDNKHFYIPQALQSYISAYDFVMKRYNLCKDGIFLGGRSMGGGMCLDILSRSNIPVKACFPVAATFNFAHYWNAIGNASNSKFIATAIGLPLNEVNAITWTNGNPMSSAEWNLLKNNFEQFLMYTPCLRIIENLPSKDELFNPEFNIDFTTATPPEAEKSLYESLRVRSNVPIKMFVSAQDSVAPYRRNSAYMYKMLRNTGSLAELRVFPTGGHCFELESQNLLETYTNNRGITLSNVPIMYIEALQFCRRYE